MKLIPPARWPAVAMNERQASQAPIAQAQPARAACREPLADNVRAKPIGEEMSKTNKDNSPKACIHITQVEKRLALEAVGIDSSGPTKGAPPAILRALPKWATAHPDDAAKLAIFVAAERPATMTAGQKSAKAIERLAKKDGAALEELAVGLDPEHRRALLLALAEADEETT